MRNVSHETLLRKPYEYYSSTACFVAGGIFLEKPDLFLLPNSICQLIAGSLIALGLCRLLQGNKIKKYQRNLKRLRRYAMSSDELPVSDKKLFLGKGFHWQAVHTQRLYELKQARGENYLKQGAFYRWARNIELHHEQTGKHMLLKKILSSKSFFNPVRPLPEVGGNAAIHGVGLTEEDIYLSLAERVGHAMILGTTRVGKTRLLELMISSDIRRNNAPVIVFDPKGDLDLLKRICYEANQAGREDDVLIFHLGFPNFSARYNPIGNFARITEVANRVANQLPSSGESAAFKEFAWRFVNIIASALAALGRRPNYKELDKYILNSDPLLLEYCELWLPEVDCHWSEKVEEAAKLIKQKKLPDHLKNRDPFIIALVKFVDGLKLNNPIYDGLKAIFNYDQTYFQKITASLSPLFAKLTTGKAAELISPDYFDLKDERPIFDWMQVIRGKKIVYIGLDALSDSTVSTAVGNSMFADLCSTIGQIYKYGIQDGIADSEPKKIFCPIHVYSDEFNELAGEEFVPLANKGGGAGLQLTVATQTGSDVLARLGSTAKANQVFGNFNTLICLRVLEEATAKLLTEKLPQKVQVKYVAGSSSANISASGHFTSNTEERTLTSEVPLISSDNLMQLPKGEAFCLLDGNKPYKVRFPLPKDDMNAMPNSVEILMRNLMSKGDTHATKT